MPPRRQTQCAADSTTMLTSLLPSTASRSRQGALFRPLPLLRWASYPSNGSHVSVTHSGHIVRLALYLDRASPVRATSLAPQPSRQPVPPGGTSLPHRPSPHSPDYACGAWSEPRGLPAQTLCASGLSRRL